VKVESASAAATRLPAGSDRERFGTAARCRRVAAGFAKNAFDEPDDGGFVVHNQHANAMTIAPETYRPSGRHRHHVKSPFARKKAFESLLKLGNSVLNRDAQTVAAHAFMSQNPTKLGEPWYSSRSNARLASQAQPWRIADVVCAKIRRSCMAGSAGRQEMSMKQLSLTLALTVVLVAGLALHAQQRTARRYVPVTDAMLQKPDAAEWLMWRRTLDGWGYSPPTQINRGNVNQLRMVWAHGLGAGNQEGTPLVHDGVMYVPDPGDHILAIDAKSGDVIWEYRRKLPEGVRPKTDRTIAI